MHFVAYEFNFSICERKNVLFYIVFKYKLQSSMHLVMMNKGKQWESWMLLAELRGV